MLLFRRVPRPPSYLCRQCIRHNHYAVTQRWDREYTPEELVVWDQRRRAIRAGAHKGVLTLLEERGFIKDIAGAGGRSGLDWLLTEKPISAYVGVDPTAPSLHVGHLLPLMALYWLHFFGFSTVTLLGGATAVIGDPSGRNSARERKNHLESRFYKESIDEQLERLWMNVKALGAKYRFPTDVRHRRLRTNNARWLKHLPAIELMKSLGSGMRLSAMLNRDSVKMRMESGAGMSFAEFSYPLFQGYDWWALNKRYEVQLQIGGSDQYGNICAGIEAVKYMKNEEQEPTTALYGITTPLLTTASGEKFGKSAGNAVWLDEEMLSSFDLYQYFLRTPDADVERYLKLFTFLHMEDIKLTMAHHHNHPEKRTAQHILAKGIVELVHGAQQAVMAEQEHRDAFSQGTQGFPIRVLRKILDRDPAGSSLGDKKAGSRDMEEDKTEEYGREDVLAKNTDKDSGDEMTVKYVRPWKADYETRMKFKRPFLAGGGSVTQSNTNMTAKAVAIPKPIVDRGDFAAIFYAAGLVSTRSEGRRLIANGGAYVAYASQSPLGIGPNLTWEHLTPEHKSPDDYIVDWEALVLRAGKSKIQVCRVVEEEEFDLQGLSCPGWEDLKARRESVKDIKEAEQSKEDKQSSEEHRQS